MKKKLLKPFKRSRKVIPTPLESRYTKAQVYMNEWVLNHHKESPRTFLKKTKKLSEKVMAEILSEFPAWEWKKRWRQVQDEVTKTQLEAQAKFIQDMSDKQMKAAGIGIDKVMEFLDELKVKSYIDKKSGTINWVQWSPKDLKDILDSLEKGQRVMRTALGLPNDEGVINVWKQLNIGTVKVSADDSKLKELEEKMSYDDIKALVAATRSGDLIIDVEPEEIKVNTDDGDM